MSGLQLVSKVKSYDPAAFARSSFWRSALSYQSNFVWLLLFCNRMLLLVRQAVLADVPALENLIRASVLGLQTADYTPEQREQALELVFGVDTQLIEDGTYFVAEAKVDGDQVMAGCGGWSKRKTLYGSDHCAGREDALLDPAARCGQDTRLLRPSWLGAPRSWQQNSGSL